MVDPTRIKDVGEILIKVHRASKQTKDTGPHVAKSIDEDEGVKVHEKTLNGQAKSHMTVYDLTPPPASSNL